ncbi:MAG TPA: peptide chain release factor N(5)-glutamine methyltransferase [Acidobacteriaceae bacterium]|jgi:release factor glutamine methyltransferase
MTVRDVLTAAAVSISLRDAELLLASTLGRERTWLLAHPEETVDTASAPGFFAAVARRSEGEPLQYILGVQEFFGLPFQVSPAVLIPRPETEHLVEAVLEWAASQPRPLRLLDVGTGSGAIALALASRLHDVEIVATDISPEALEVARGNSVRLGLETKVRFVEGDLLAGIGELDAVVSNPPYVPSGDAGEMQPEVVRYEPHTALFAGPDGLDVYRRLIPAAASALRPGGLLAMEIGFGQRKVMEELLAGWRGLHFLRDYADIDRVALAERW